MSFSQRWYACLLTYKRKKITFKNIVIELKSYRVNKKKYPHLARKTLYFRHLCFRMNPVKRRVGQNGKKYDDLFPRNVQKHLRFDFGIFTGKFAHNRFNLINVNIVALQSHAWIYHKGWIVPFIDWQIICNPCSAIRASNFSHVQVYRKTKPIQSTNCGSGKHFHRRLTTLSHQTIRLTCTAAPVGWFCVITLIDSMLDQIAQHGRNHKYQLKPNISQLESPWPTCRGGWVACLITCQHSRDSSYANNKRLTNARAHCAGL